MQNNTFFEDSTPNNIIVFEELPSTNDYLKELLSKVKPLDPHTVIMTKNQTAGKGQRGNQWKSAANQNLTASFLISPEKLDISNQFSLTLIASLAVYDTLKTFVKQDVAIKWPNDILINNKKIAGILIENKISGSYIKHSIVGIGINVYQYDFPAEIDQKTTSLILENELLVVKILQLAHLIQEKIKHYTVLSKENNAALLNLYNQKLFRKHELHSYNYEGNIVKGKIIKVESDGLLQIEIKNKLHKVDLKGITYIL
ncbi:biotin--[acetyl-CoA-carboxylase] ligase [Sphingobacterium bovistauri]|uniref:Biotin--[acetyl-CoA-carboxylase] ligase n=1 Tax=Sphingobacterium bovistauri TaxID=2781959 RepID=A0ABS7Z726_9SPHI|nr:biotin--[acetyl-CoA-carboxylase] ligase [Sphingobacterium bovistauri]MCA5005985.1 biotin--[acetyl-CoA-carboxylase] ligase [Sphingobacterium bovistauri]